MPRFCVLARLLVLTLLASCATTATTAGTVASAPTPQPFHVERSGQGRPLVFIPGLASSGEVWAETVQHLQGRYDCHVLTLAGFAGQPAIPAPFLATERRAVADYLRAKGLQKPILVGHSLGGVLALAVAADAPDLVGGVVVVDSLPFLPAAMDPSATADSMRPRAEEMRTLMRMQTVEQRSMQSRMALQRYISDEAKQQVAARWGADSDPETVAQAVYEMSTTDLRPELPRITAPTLVLGSWVAMKGRVPREAVEAVYRGQYQSLSTGRVVMNDSARHFIMWDDPQGFFRELDAFLGTTAPVARAAQRP
ncbi:alpha/beta hydrolase [Pyxidicoccus fallax]|uniref:Alpha/beta hydrolase n=1 Tax=Pyxidicoccus fallax TaxID=394095 RepID=A0A848LIT7_9BACT|nr:alpha/beta hydrolase [Pyxidicoccus fallax]NMO17633.1 alpha/beta hydrolase [Pyxidicoccus fallax]NPC84586.1 alpha/beta hydrolase [Pyxidicoccus fallax]